MNDLKRYLRLLDAEAEGADWKEIALLLLNVDVAVDPHAARQHYLKELSKAQQLAETVHLRLMREPGGH